MRQALLALVAIGLVASLAGAGTMAFFSDTETSSGNTFTAGTLDLKVDGQDNPNVVSVSLGDMKPGDSHQFKWELAESWESTLQGYISVCFSDIVNYEEGQNEPEALVDPTDGDLEGELGEMLQAKIGVCGTGTNWRWYWIGPMSLNDLGGKCYAEDGIFNGASTLLYPRRWGITFKLDVWLPEDVGNIVQSDSVEFDVVFRLEQA